MPGYFSSSSFWNLLVNIYPVSERRYIPDSILKEMQSTIDRLHLFLVCSLCMFISFLTMHRNIKSHMFLVLIYPDREEEVDCFNNGIRHYNCERICCAGRYKLFQQRRGVSVNNPLAPSPFTAVVANSPVAIPPQVPPMPWHPKASSVSS